MAELVVAHLARRRNGIAPLVRFLNSYSARNPGAKHSLLIVLKGFEGSGDDCVRSILQSVPCQTVSVEDRGFDIRAYFAAARAVECRYICFLNSFSEIVADGWLGFLLSAIKEPGVGLVGASGTWQSLKSNYLRQPGETGSGLRTWRYARNVARFIRYHIQLRWSFPDFPNPHVRTNAFLIERDRLLQLRPPRDSKMDNYRFESGCNGLSRSIVEAGFELRIVGRDGRAYAAKEWRTSRIFWSGEQENLLVTDNQSRLYDAATAEVKALLRTYAWGSAD